MNRFLLLIMFAFISELVFTSKQTEASLDPKIHKYCKNAKDYKGCVRSIQNSNNSKSSIESMPEEDNCFGALNAVESWCFAGKGKDFLGEEKIRGWLYREVPEHKMVSYAKPTTSQLKVDNQYGRYLITKTIVRSFREFIADRPMQEVIVGGTKTDCSISGFGTTNTYGNSYGSSYGDSSLNHRFRSFNNYSGSMNCETSAPQTMWMPGQIGQSEGVNQYIFRDIIDCDTKEFANIFSKRKGNKLSEWQKVKGINEGLATKDCRNYMLLPKSKNIEFAKTKLRD